MGRKELFYPMAQTKRQGRAEIRPQAGDEHKKGGKETGNKARFDKEVGI
jgi:hypothetical protein